MLKAKILKNQCHRVNKNLNRTKKEITEPIWYGNNSGIIIAQNRN